MTRAALTKLFILVILAFFICLPEFFSLYRVSKVNFHCQPYQPCKRGNQTKKGEYGKTGDAKIKRKDMRDSSQTPEHKKWEQACTQANQSNTTDPTSDLRRGDKDPEDSWFQCQTDMDMAELHSNILSSALKVYLEVSVEFQLNDTETLNLTLYGRSNYSSLHLHPPEQEEDGEEKKTGDEGQKEAFYCCFPALPTSESANQSHCLIWLANQTVLTATAKEKLPWKRTQKDEWWCTFRVLWLALLCVVLLTIVTTVIGQIYRQKRKNPKVRPVDYHFTGQQLNDGERHTQITPKGTIHHSQSQPCLGLSPIQECEVQEEIETLLDGNVNSSYNANLHHRVHPSTSVLTEEQD